MSQKPHVLLLDDDPLCIEALKLTLEPTYRCVGFTEVQPAKQWFLHKRPDIVLIDLHLKEGSSFSLIKEWKTQNPETEFVVCSGEKNVELAIECIRQGAIDYVLKPYSKADLLLILQRAMEKIQLKKRVEKLNPLVFPRPITFISQSPKMQEVLEKVQLLKNQPHLNVLILGESGTGKEIIARLLHQQEENRERPFVVANMPAIPATLMESELFGSEKGAYTDSKASRAGKFELADGGDIFLDEIGDLPMETQSKILRVLQERQVERVGGSAPRQVQFRVISATNQPLSDLMSHGRFREDLIYRLSDLVLWLAPLREHREDIPSLVDHFIQKYCMKKEKPALSESALKTLMAYHWPGNIRQLESTIKRALIFNRGTEIREIELYDPLMLNPVKSSLCTQSLTYESQVMSFERQVLENAVKRHAGNKSLAIEELGISKATFYRKSQELGVSV